MTNVLNWIPKELRETAVLRAYSFLKIPLIYQCSPRVVVLTDKKCVVKFPLNRRTKNHLNSMYFGALCIGADCGGGLMAMRLIQKRGNKISLVFKDMKAEFLKRAEGDVHFTCVEGEAIQEFIKKVEKSGKRENLPVRITATVPKKTGTEPVAEFVLTLSLKSEIVLKGYALSYCRLKGEVDTYSLTNKMEKGEAAPVQDLVAINGEVFDPQDAKISVFDRGFLFGDSVYEVARSYSRIYFELEKHIERLFNSASMMSLDLQRTRAQIMDEIYSISAQSNLENAYMRIIVTRGGGKLSIDPRSTQTPPNRIIFIKKLELPTAEIYEKGASVVISGVNRNSRKSLDPNIKSGNYLNNILAYMDAAKAGAFESIMLNQEGNLTEATVSNFFVVKNGIVHTAPMGFDILTGITRGVVQDICKAEGITFKESIMPAQMAFDANECFLTGSTREVVPVVKIDGKTIAGGRPGPVTSKLHQAYKKTIQNYCDARKTKRYIL